MDKCDGNQILEEDSEKPAKIMEGRLVWACYVLEERPTKTEYETKVRECESGRLDKGRS